MNTYYVRVWTGPSIVEQIAEIARSKGFDVLVGTEHLYFNVFADDQFEAKEIASIACWGNKLKTHSGWVSIISTSGFNQLIA